MVLMEGETVWDKEEMHIVTSQLLTRRHISFGPVPLTTSVKSRDWPRTTTNPCFTNHRSIKWAWPWESILNHDD